MNIAATITINIIDSNGLNLNQAIAITINDIAVPNNAWLNINATYISAS